MLIPPSLPTCAASLRPSMVHARQGSVRIHALYASSRGGPLRVEESERRCGLRPWIAQARWERSWSSVSMVCQGEMAASRDPLPCWEV